MAERYKVLELTGSHLQSAIDLYNLLINHNGKKNFTVGPFASGVATVKLKVEFKKNNLVRILGEFLTVHFILNLHETSAVIMCDRNIDDAAHIGTFYDMVNILGAADIYVQINVIRLSDSIMQDFKNNYVATTDEVIIKAGNALKDVDKIVAQAGGSECFEGFKTEDLNMEIFLENTPNKHVQEIIKCVKDLYGGSNFRVCFTSDAHEYLVLVYSDVGVYYHKSLEFNRSEQMCRILYKDIVMTLNKEIDAPININLRDVSAKTGYKL